MMVLHLQKEELDGAISETSEKLKATDGLETYTANGVSVQADPYEAVLITEPHLHHTLSQCHYGPAAYPF